MDDFILMSQCQSKQDMILISRKVLHAIHTVFPPPNITGHNGDDPISVKKLIEGEGLWEYRKTILGWIFDGIARSIELPEKKVKEILQELKTIGRKRNIPLERYQKILGRLRHAAIGIPTGKGLFTPLYIALKSNPKIVHLNKDIVLALRDWRTLIKMA